MIAVEFTDKMIKFWRIPGLILLRLAWFLEDVIDKILGVERGSMFYPSAIFEDILDFYKEEGKCEFEEECKIELSFEESCPFYEKGFCRNFIPLKKNIN